MVWLHDVHQLTHLRLKPSNILFFSDGGEWRSKVADYDLGFPGDDGPHKIEPPYDKFIHDQYFAPEICVDPHKPDIDLKAADVWSFGMLLYTLYTYKEPFENVPDLKKNIQKVTEEELSKLFNINSSLLKNLLMDCCHLEPSKRSPFHEIKKKIQYPQILQELDKTESLTEKIWGEATKSDHMPFNSFYIFLSKYFGLKKNTEEAHYLKELLRLSFTLKVGETEPANMTYDNFRVICRLFKINQERDKGFIERMIEVFRSDWFYGYVDREDAQKQLDALAISKKKKDPPTNYIVRFANSKKLCVTFKKKDGTWENANIEPHVAMEHCGYISYVNEYATKMNITYEQIHLLKSFKSFKNQK